jgi:AraC-like DNA-binding protein
MNRRSYAGRRAPSRRLREKPRLLFVEPDVRLLCALMPLLDSCAEVVIATTANDAGRVTSLPAFQVAVVNMDMRGLRGDFLLPVLRARHPACRIIVVPGSGGTPSMGEVGADTVDAICQSPSIGDVLACLAVFLVGAPHRRLDGAVLGVIQAAATQGARDLSLTTLADRCGKSRGRLAYLFHSEVGMTVGAYVRCVSTWTARLLLGSSDDKLDVIAEKSGFYDASHLSRVFRAMTGVTPGEYRRRA